MQYTNAQKRLLTAVLGTDRTLLVIRTGFSQGIALEEVWINFDIKKHPWYDKILGFLVSTMLENKDEYKTIQQILEYTAMVAKWAPGGKSMVLIG